MSGWIQRIANSFQRFGVWWRSRALRSRKIHARVRAVDKLSHVASEQAATPLIQALADPDADVRAKALTGLGVSGQARAIEPIVQLLLTETDREVLHAGIRALQRLDRDQVAKSLLAAMEAPDPTLSLNAASALRKVGWEEASPQDRARAAIVRNAWDDAVDLGDAAISPLEETVRQGTRRMKREAAEALGAIGTQQALGTLMNLMTDPSVDDAARDIAAWSISKFFWNDLDETQAAHMAIAKRDWTSLAHLGPPAVGILRETISKGDAAVRPQIVETLGKIGGVEACRALEDALSGAEQDVLVREAAARALGRSNDLAVIPALVTALSDEAWKVREAAAAALHAMEWQPSTEQERALYAVVNKDWEGAVALGEAAIEALRGALRYMSVSMTAANALVRIGTTGVDALVAVLRDPSQPVAVREVVATTLAALGDRRAIEPMQAMLGDRDMALRQQAVWTLEQLGWQPKDDKQKAAAAIAHEDWTTLATLGTAAVEPLINLAGDGMMPNETATALRELLEKSSERLSINQLRELAGLQDIKSTTPGSTTSTEAGGVATARAIVVDCGKIRQLARWELFRRGIMF